MAGTMLGEAVTFDPSRELRPTPNTSIFPKLEVAIYNFKMLYPLPTPYAEGLVIKKKKKTTLVSPLSQRQANRLPAHSARQGVSDWRAGSAGKTQSPHAST